MMGTRPFSGAELSPPWERSLTILGHVAASGLAGPLLARAGPSAELRAAAGAAERLTAVGGLGCEDTTQTLGGAPLTSTLRTRQTALSVTGACG